MTWLCAGTDDAWTPTDYILADLIDVMIAANSEDKPKPYSRPRDIKAQQGQRDKAMTRAQRFREKQERKARRER